MRNIDDLLQESLADYRFSRGEKQALTKILSEAKAYQRQLAFLRHRAFEIARKGVIGPEAKQIIEWLDGVVKVLLPNESSQPAGPVAEARIEARIKIKNQQESTRIKTVYFLTRIKTVYFFGGTGFGG